MVLDPFLPSAGLGADVGAGVDAGCDSGVGTGGWVESCLGMVRLEPRKWAVSPEHGVTVQRPGYSIRLPANNASEAIDRVLVLALDENLGTGVEPRRES